MRKLDPKTFSNVCTDEVKEDRLWSLGVSAGFSTGGSAALLFFWTLTVVNAELCTHVGSLGFRAASVLHCRTRTKTSSRHIHVH